MDLKESWLLQVCVPKGVLIWNWKLAVLLRLLQALGIVMAIWAFAMDFGWMLKTADAQTSANIWMDATPEALHNASRADQKRSICDPKKLHFLNFSASKFHTYHPNGCMAPIMGEFWEKGDNSVLIPTYVKQTQRAQDSGLENCVALQKNCKGQQQAFYGGVGRAMNGENLCVCDTHSEFFVRGVEGFRLTIESQYIVTEGRFHGAGSTANIKDNILAFIRRPETETLSTGSEESEFDVTLDDAKKLEKEAGIQSPLETGRDHDQQRMRFDDEAVLIEADAQMAHVDSSAGESGISNGDGDGGQDARNDSLNSDAQQGLRSERRGKLKHMATGRRQQLRRLRSEGSVDVEGNNRGRDRDEDHGDNDDGAGDVECHGRKCHDAAAPSRIQQGSVRGEHRWWHPVEIGRGVWRLLAGGAGGTDPKGEFLEKPEKKADADNEPVVVAEKVFEPGEPISMTIAHWLNYAQLLDEKNKRLMPLLNLRNESITKPYSLLDIPNRWVSTSMLGRRNVVRRAPFRMSGIELRVDLCFKNKLVHGREHAGTALDVKVVAIPVWVDWPRSTHLEYQDPVTGKSKVLLRQYHGVRVAIAPKANFVSMSLLAVISIISTFIVVYQIPQMICSAIALYLMGRSSDYYYFQTHERVQMRRSFIGYLIRKASSYLTWKMKADAAEDGKDGAAEKGTEPLEAPKGEAIADAAKTDDDGEDGTALDIADLIENVNRSLGRNPECAKPLARNLLIAINNLYGKGEKREKAPIVELTEAATIDIQDITTEELECLYCPDRGLNIFERVFLPAEETPLGLLGEEAKGTTK